MIAEVIDTAITLGWALTGWIITLAAIASILTLTAIATGAYGIHKISYPWTCPGEETEAPGEVVSQPGKEA